MMKKRKEKTVSIFLILFCMGISFGYAFGQSNENVGDTEAITQVVLPKEEQETEEGTQIVLPEEEQETEEGTQVVLPEEEQETEEETQFFLSEEEQKITENAWANSYNTRINYMDGYYYYASQSDHYYLYRLKEDGSDFQCMAKIHPGSICAQDGYVYFINQSDGHGIYRIKADGTGMEKLCENGHNLQVCGEYVFFCSNYYEEELETTGVIVGTSGNGGYLYRMKKDGSERKLIAEDVWQYVTGDGYSQGIRDTDAVYYSRQQEDGLVVYKIDFDGQKKEELCNFDVWGNLAVYGSSLYCMGSYAGSRGKIIRFSLADGEKSSIAVPKYGDCCIYKGHFYGLREQEEEEQRKVSIYRLDLDSGNSKMFYEYTFQCRSWEEGAVSDIYATEKGVFFRRFVSEQEGCRWFKLTEDGNAQELEDREKIPVTLPARQVYYGDLISVLRVLKDMSTEGYEAYLGEGLDYEEYLSVSEDGEQYNSCDIHLPQFNSKIPGYQKINAYFQNVYQAALQEKDDLVQMLKEEGPELTRYYSQYISYCYVYIGEDYITVFQDNDGHSGVSNRVDTQPVTFDWASGEEVSLEQLLGTDKQEAVARLTGAIYKYMEGRGRGTFMLREGNLLTEECEPENFLLFSEGIGIYYPRYAIDCGAAGDFLFIIPWEDLSDGSE